MLPNQGIKDWLKSVILPKMICTCICPNISAASLLPPILTINLSSLVYSQALLASRNKIASLDYFLISLTYECQWHPEGRNLFCSRKKISVVIHAPGLQEHYSLTSKSNCKLHWCWCCLRTNHAVRSLSDCQCNCLSLPQPIWLRWLITSTLPVIISN